ncbi:glycosyltransferase family 39 protein [Clostridium sp. SYSU_GA19001]|uniref:glycosyltransferase family 39 protein n=1 Tax=Clostridium caldaquaticum TaxID=2940653 RepID=UPI0020772356|nr:glycosyltransferase family 39 protein [Clostridium caldaquaticum]MCM8709406.1 glycosyltransferase family 39 protein [Clostridium caldaquaticum]
MITSKLDKERLFVVVLIACSFFLYIAWAVIIPFDHAPDEFQRFDIVNFIIKYRNLPISGDIRLFYGDYGISYATTPYLPYIISAGLCIFADKIGVNLPVYIISRMLSVFSGVGTVYFSWLISKRIFKQSKVKYFFPLFLAFIPQFAFISAYTNQDAFTVFLSSIMIYLWLLGLESNWGYNVVIKVGIVSGLMALSYLNGYSIILATLFIVLITYKNKLSNSFFKKLLLCIFIIFIVSGWFFIRNYLIYDGDFLGRNYGRALSEKLAIPKYKPSIRNTLKHRGLGIRYLLFNTNWLSDTFKSFWGYFDYMILPMNNKYYFLMFLIVAASLIGLFYKIVYYYKTDIKMLMRNKFYIALAFTSVISFILHSYYSIYSDYQPQGRYLFPALIALIILLCKGLDGIIADKYKSIVYKLLGILAIMSNFMALFYIIFLNYYVF